MSGRGGGMSAGRPIAYRRWERIADRQRGRRDGRRRIPSYTSLVVMIGAEARVTAPYLEKLALVGLQQIDEEYRAFEARAFERRRRLAGLQQELVAAVAAVERGTAEVVAAETELNEEELRPRNPSELRMQDPTMLRSRRVAMRERRISIAQGRLAGRIAAVDELNKQIAATLEEIRQEFVLAQAQARCIGDYYALRAAAYWEGVAQAHPEGRQLALLSRYLVSKLPAWATASPETDPARLEWRPLELGGLAAGPAELHALTGDDDPVGFDTEEGQ